MEGGRNTLLMGGGGVVGLKCDQDQKGFGRTSRRTDTRLRQKIFAHESRVLFNCPLSLAVLYPNEI